MEREEIVMAVVGGLQAEEGVREDREHGDDHADDHTAAELVAVSDLDEGHEREDRDRLERDGPREDGPLDPAGLAHEDLC